MVNKFHYRFGGAETYYFNLSDLLTEEGHSVFHFAMSHPRNEPSEESDLFVDFVDYNSEASIYSQGKAAISSIYSVQARHRMSRLIDRVKPDIVHLHNYNYQLTPSILYSIKARGIPVVHTMHDAHLVCPHHRLYDYNRGSICERCRGLRFRNAISTKCMANSYVRSTIGAIESYLYHALKTYDKCIDLFICPSIFLKEKTIEMGYSPSKIRVIPNFIDTERILSGPDSADYAVYVGRLSAEKGIRTLLAAMKEVKGGRLVIVGDGPMRAEIEAELEGSNLGNVVLLGHKSPAEVLELVRRSAFSVLPSEWYENLPMSVLESFACGKPVLASALGGLKEMVEPGVTGLLHAPRDYHSLAANMNCLFGSSDLRQKFGDAARNVAVARYSKKEHIARILEAYHSAAHSPS